MDEIKNLNSNILTTGAKSLTAATAQSKEIQIAKAKEAATQFESLLLHQMFNSMSANVAHDKLLGDGRDQEFARDMYNQALAESISKGKGLGIRDILEKEMIKNINRLSEK